MKATETEKVVLRKPEQKDASAVWSLIQRCEPLDQNSCYAYVLLCTHFRETCVVAEMDGNVVGFVSGYIPPESPETLFIWQVAVDASARGLGLGRGMILDILLRDACQDVTQLETTVGPSNEASRRMFQGVARRMSAEFSESPYISSDMLGDDEHEDENLITIGPFNPVNA